MIQSLVMVALRRTRSAEEPVTQRFNFRSSAMKIYTIILAVALVSGIATGYVLASSKGSGGSTPIDNINTGAPATAANQDTQTFRDFAEGVIQKKPASSKSDYSEGTHLLIRQNAVPVALTSSVVDLSQYEGKKVKVFGETQQALKEGWLMDVGRVEVE